MSVITGASAGQIVMERGPLAPADLDESCRSDDGAFWREHVLANVGARRNEFFRQDVGLSYAGGEGGGAVQYVRFFEVRPGSESEARDWMARVSERLRERGAGGSWAFFTNLFEVSNSDVYHMAIASYHRGWRHSPATSTSRSFSTPS